MGKKVKVVPDTNIWISILFDRLLTKDFLPLVNEEEILVYLSEELLKEPARVLTYSPSANSKGFG